MLPNRKCPSGSNLTHIEILPYRSMARCVKRSKQIPISGTVVFLLYPKEPSGLWSILRATIPGRDSHLCPSTLPSSLKTVKGFCAPFCLRNCATWPYCSSPSGSFSITEIVRVSRLPIIASARSTNSFPFVFRHRMFRGNIFRACASQG